MTIRNTNAYIYHILESIEIIESYIKGCDGDNFADEQMRWDAILRQLQTTAESTKRLPIDVKQKYPQIAWKDIAGFRNVLVHDYLEGAEEEIIWHVITVELIKLKEVMLELCPDWEEIKKKRLRKKS